MAEQRSPARSPAPNAWPETPRQNALWRVSGSSNSDVTILTCGKQIILTPITFFSFLVSLALISERNVALRTTTHNHGAYPNTIIGNIKTFLHALAFKRVPTSPYAYVRSPNPSSSAVNQAGKDNVEKEPWHWHSKQRQMMRAEVDDAFRVRKSVVVVLGTVLLGSLLLSCWSVRWLWRVVGSWAAAAAEL